MNSSMLQGPFYVRQEGAATIEVLVECISTSWSSADGHSEDREVDISLLQSYASGLILPWSD